MKTLVASLYLLSATLALAIDQKAPAATAPAYTLSQFSLGGHITGPQQTLADAAGKAVVIDAWGVHCGPCLASLPSIEALARRYQGKMLVFGAHVQGGPAEAVKAVATQNKLTYTITNGVQSPVQFRGIPHVFVFDTKGAMLFSGHPADPNFGKAVQHATQGVSATATAAAGTARPSGLDSLKKPGSSNLPAPGTTLPMRMPGL